jgi:hypothetical protein
VLPNHRQREPRAAKRFALKRAQIDIAEPDLAG